VRVAVLIINYRTYDALDRCLASLGPFTSETDEVVVVDWQSEAARREAIASRHHGVRFISRADNLGFSAGVNLAAAATTAPVLLLLNPDTEVEGPIVRALGGWLEARPACGVVGPRVVNVDGTVQPSARRFPGLTTVFGGRSTWLTRRFPNNWFSRHNLLQDAGSPREGSEADWVAGSCFATRRDVFERLGGLDESFFMYWEDADYCRRARALGLHCHYLPTSTVRHTGGLSSALNVVPSIRAFHRSAFHLYWKYARLGRVFAPVVWLGLMARAEVKVALRGR
jgi:N-acetylglucosaminyl-diphospho-decaprenol L-rhamnosyltransferase